MENLEAVFEDPTIKAYLKKFPKVEWGEVLKKTLKLGIHSMNTLHSLSLISISPEKSISIIDVEGGLEDDSTIALADSLIKNDRTTPSSKEGTKILRNISKLPSKKKKASSLVNKTKISRVTPKSKRCGFEILRDKKDNKRIHSVKNKYKIDSHRPVASKETQNPHENFVSESKKKLNCEKYKENNCAKSFKSLKNKGLELQLSPKHHRLSPKGVKNSLGMHDLSEFYRNNMSCRNQPVEFPLRIKKTLDMDPFVYITSSSEEESP
ncbi:hypothetical protein SteCoe_27027 [Stentor coeruleus]|uniref:Uncharacterized protein n=1 Tax=Stentor coeruleus TaxID=5963 RepID=A0A1R2BBL1_9CILI|nr:hypothetical protein SteCoe_27027 [Stentor coeruleus]